MKKSIITFCIALTLIGITRFIGNGQKSEVIINFDIHKKTKVIEIKNSPDEKKSSITKRSPAQVTKPQPRRPTFKPLDLKEIELHYALNEHIFFVKNIRAIPKNKYHPSMGEVIHEDLSSKYIRASEKNTPAASLSIYDTKRKRLFPVSHIIRIPNTNEERRIEITSRGFKENLYLEKLELLFVETKKTDFSIVFEELKQEGFAPQYQLINREHIPR